jgi:hypothetical protein
MAMTHGLDLQPGIEKGKSFKILAFSGKDYQAIPISFYEKPISLYEKPNYEVGFSSNAPPPRQSQKPPMDDNEDGVAPQ